MVDIYLFSISILGRNELRANTIELHSKVRPTYLNDNYKSYVSALEMLKIDTLQERRRKQCLKFAKDCLKHEQMKKMYRSIMIAVRYFNNMNH